MTTLGENASVALDGAGIRLQHASRADAKNVSARPVG